MEIRRATFADYEAIEELYDLSFAPGRYSLSSYKLRKNIKPIAELSLVVEEDDAIIAAIQYWPVLTGGEPSLMLGPLAVHPIAQGMGLAGLLIAESLEIAKEKWARVILIGDAGYYNRFGFFKRYTEALTFPPPTNPDRFLGLPLKEDAFLGVKGSVDLYDL